MLKSFFNYLEHEKRYSKHTVTSYKNDLFQFEEFLKDKFEAHLNEVSFQMVRSWIVELIDTGNTPRSVNRKISSLRSFYKHLRSEGTIKSDPLLKIKPIKTPKKLPNFVKETDMVQLLDHYEFKKDFSGIRDRLTLELLYGTGIRLSELINIENSDIDFHKKTLKVLGKRNKERIIPLPESLLYLMRNYQQEKAKVLDKKSDRLLVTDKGEPCYPMFIYRLVKKHLDSCTSIEKRSPHVLRHTFATHLLNKGADLNAVKDLLGHAGLAATQVYTHNSLDKIKRVFNQAHPKA